MIAVGRGNWQFAGSERGGKALATLFTLIETAKLNGLNPREWLVDTLQRLPALPNNRLHELLPCVPPCATLDGSRERGKTGLLGRLRLWQEVPEPGR